MPSHSCDIERGSPEANRDTSSSLVGSPSAANTGAGAKSCFCGDIIGDVLDVEALAIGLAPPAEVEGIDR